MDNRTIERHRPLFLVTYTESRVSHKDVGRFISGHLSINFGLDRVDTLALSGDSYVIYAVYFSSSFEKKLATLLDWAGLLRGSRIF